MYFPGQIASVSWAIASANGHPCWRIAHCRPVATDGYSCGAGSGKLLLGYILIMFTYLMSRSRRSGRNSWVTRPLREHNARRSFRTAQIRKNVQRLLQKKRAAAKKAAKAGAPQENPEPVSDAETARPNQNGKRAKKKTRRRGG